LILFTLWRIVLTVGTIVALYVLRPVLFLVLLPFIIMMKIISNVGRLMFGTRNPRPKSTHANTGTGMNINSKQPATTMGNPGTVTRKDPRDLVPVQWTTSPHILLIQCLYSSSLTTHCSISTIYPSHNKKALSKRDDGFTFVVLYN